MKELKNLTIKELYEELWKIVEKVDVELLRVHRECLEHNLDWLQHGILRFVLDTSEHEFVKVTFTIPFGTNSPNFLRLLIEEMQKRFDVSDMFEYYKSDKFKHSSDEKIELFLYTNL